MTESRGRRRGKNNVQELKSLSQVSDALADWLPNRLSEDFGEDLIVQIEDDGEWSGLSFFLQAKSSQDLVGTRLKRAPVHSYSLEVTDLSRWEDASPPVVVVVWDVEKKTGIWIDVPAAIGRLNEANEGWREQKTATVHFPLENRLDLAEGQRKLRRRLADLAIPAIGKGKTVTFKPTFRFPKDEEGQALWAQVRKTIEEGGTVRVPGKYIQSVKMSDWWERLYGKSETSEVTELRIGPSSSDVQLGLELVAVGPGRSYTMPIVLSRTSGGTHKIQFSNMETDDPVRLTLVLPGAHAPKEAELKGKASLVFPGSNVSTTSRMVPFLLAVHDAGLFRVRHQNSGVWLGELRADALANVPDVEELEGWERLVQKLTYIESYTSKYGRFDLSNGVSDEDLTMIERLYAMCKGDPWEASVTLRFSLEPGFVEPEEKAGEVTMTPAFFGTWKLLGVEIPLKTVCMTVKSSDTFLRALREAIGAGGSTVEIKDLTISHKLLAWGDVEHESV